MDQAALDGALDRRRRRLAVQIVVVCSAARATGWLFTKIRQPRVVERFLRRPVAGAVFVRVVGACGVILSISATRVGSALFLKPSRPAAFHLPGGTRVGCARAPENGARSRTHQQHQHPDTVSGRRRPGAISLSPAIGTGSAGFDFCPVHGHRDEYHGISGAGADSQPSATCCRAKLAP